MWLLEATVLDRLNKALAMGADALGPRGDVRGPSNRALSTDDSGKVATIRVEGILTKTADPFMSFFFGANTAYDDIIAQIGAAERDQKVSAIQFDIDSPGGNVDGLFDTLAAIEAAQKPMSVRARNAQSAAYGIAAAAGNIVATGPGASFGSVGTAISMHVSDEIVTIASSNAPEKRPDPRTEEGRASIVRHLDAIDELFVEAIAGGRGISADSVRQNFGRGASLLAGEAKQRGMIDGIAGANLRVVQQPKATADGGSEECMDLEQLKAEHPAVYKAAVEDGVKQERDRVVAHLSLAKSGDLEVAHAAIESGDILTQAIMAKHFAASLNKRDVATRQKESDEAAEATEGANGKSDDKDELGEAVFGRLTLLVGNQSVEV